MLHVLNVKMDRALIEVLLRGIERSESQMDDLTRNEYDNVHGHEYKEGIWHTFGGSGELEFQNGRLMCEPDYKPKNETDINSSIQYKAAPFMLCAFARAFRKKNRSILEDYCRNAAPLTADSFGGLVAVQRHWGLGNMKKRIKTHRDHFWRLLMFSGSHYILCCVCCVTTRCVREGGCEGERTGRGYEVVV